MFIQQKIKVYFCLSPITCFIIYNGDKAVRRLKSKFDQRTYMLKDYNTRLECVRCSSDSCKTNNDDVKNDTTIYLTVYQINSE